jgi:tripartite-type tricarboxylate transporter receptor subunit TctC
MPDKNRRALLFGLLGSTLAGRTRAQQATESFYKGKTVDMYIGFAPGGGYDFYAQIYARYMPRYVPGNPTFVLQHMPGAGSLKAANYLYNEAARDGTALGVVTQTFMLEEAMGTQGVRYKSADFSYIGRMSAVVEVEIISKAAKAKTIEDVRHYETTCGGSGPTSPSEGYPRLLNAFAGTKFKIISGYPGAADIMTALERGEVDAMENSWNLVSQTKKAQLASGDIKVLVQGALARSPALPDIPTVVEVGETPEGKAALEFYTSSVAVGRAIIAPPGVPPERVKILRDAFNAVQNDPELIAEIKKTGADFDPAPGEYLQDLAKKISATSPDIISRTSKALKPL